MLAFLLHPYKNELKTRLKAKYNNRRISGTYTKRMRKGVLFSLINKYTRDSRYQVTISPVPIYSRNNSTTSLHIGSSVSRKSGTTVHNTHRGYSRSPSEAKSASHDSRLPLPLP